MGSVDGKFIALLTVFFDMSCMYDPLLSVILLALPVLILALADAVTFFLLFGTGAFLVLGIITQFKTKVMK